MTQPLSPENELAMEMEAWSRNLAGCPWSPWGTDTRILLEKAAKALRGHAQSTRDAVIEECAQIAEAQAQEFLSPKYASNQPFGSTCERFACNEVAKAIRALSVTSTERPQCSHPHARLWMYRDDDTWMICPDCFAKWVERPSTVPSTVARCTDCGQPLPLLYPCFQQGCPSCASTLTSTVRLSEHNQFNPETEYPGSYGALTRPERSEVEFREQSEAHHIPMGKPVDNKEGGACAFKLCAGCYTRAECETARRCFAGKLPHQADGNTP